MGARLDVPNVSGLGVLTWRDDSSVIKMVTTPNQSHAILSSKPSKYDRKRRSPTYASGKNPCCRVGVRANALVLAQCFWVAVKGHQWGFRSGRTTRQCPLAEGSPRCILGAAWQTKCHLALIKALSAPNPGVLLCNSRTFPSPATAHVADFSSVTIVSTCHRLFQLIPTCRNMAFRNIDKVA